MDFLWVILAIFFVAGCYIFIGMGIAKTFMFTQRRTSPEDGDVFILVFWPGFLLIFLPLYGIFIGCDYVWAVIFKPLYEVRRFNDRMIEDQREKEYNYKRKTHRYGM